MINYTIRPTDPSPLVNTGTVSGKDLEGEDVTAVATHSTTLAGYTPVLFVDKDGPSTANVGDTVVYYFTVVNLNSVSIAWLNLSPISAASIGDGSPVSNITVNDNIAGPATYVSGDFNGNGRLDRTEAWLYTASYTIGSTDPNPLFNQVTVRGQDQEGDVLVATDIHRTSIVSTDPANLSTIFLPIVMK